MTEVGVRVMRHELSGIGLVTAETGVIVAKFRGQVSAQSSDRAACREPKREAFLVDRLLPFGDRAKLSIEKTKISRTSVVWADSIIHRSCRNEDHRLS